MEPEQKEREWDFKAEQERLKKEYEANSKFVKFADGEQKNITFLDNGGYPYTNQKFDDKPEMVAYKVSIDAHDKSMEVNTKSKLYAQLIEHGAKLNGLKGHTFAIKREGLGNKTKYTIVVIS